MFGTDDSKPGVFNTALLFALLYYKDVRTTRGVRLLQNIPYREGTITSLMSLACELLDQIAFDTGLEHFIAQKNH